MEPRKFYLGEDPFGGSIYGREREYDGVTPPRRGRHHSNRAERRGSQESNEDTVQHGRSVPWRAEVLHRTSSSPAQQHQQQHGSVTVTTHTNSSTLGRYQQQRAGGQQHTELLRDNTPRSTQTLPRKLHSHHRTEVVHQVNSPPSHVTSRGLNSSRQHTGSLINVSFVNNVTPQQTAGPAKPARTYRSNLARSQSFNVQESAPPPRRLFSKTAANYRSNPHLDEAPSPLKSPGIISSISRSQRDLSEALNTETLHEEDENRFSGLKNGYVTPHKNINPASKAFASDGFESRKLSNEYEGYGIHESKKKLFMKGLLDRAPELYRTLHGEDTRPLSSSTPQYSASFRENPGVRPARVKRNSGTLLSPSQSFRSVTNDGKDFSETVRTTSTSDDPLRPSVTNTVQSFSKKTTPRASGGLATETVESTETTTVTKSRAQGSGFTDSQGGRGKYLFEQQQQRNGGGVVIEVRNNK